MSDWVAFRMILGVMVAVLLGYWGFSVYYRRSLRPSKLRFREEESGLMVRYGWMHHSLIFSKPSMAALPLLTVPIWVPLAFGHAAISVAESVASVLVGCLLAYPSLLAVVNKTTVFASQDRRIIVRHGPLPGRDHDPAQTIQDVANVYYRQEFVREYRRPMVAFPIMAYTIPGHLIQFMDHIDAEEDAKAIVLRIRQSLKLPQDVSLKLPPS